MGRPIAYEYRGFMFNGESVPVWTDDTDSTQHYYMPPSLRVATDAAGPKVTVSVCQTLAKPAADGLANLVPYLSEDLSKALKKEFGPRIAPLPVSTGGQVMIVGPNWTRRGLAVHKVWDTDSLSYEGMSPDQVAKLKEAKQWYEEDGIEKPLTAALTDGEGWALEIPKLIGSNIGAEVPISFVVLGADNVTRFKSLLDAPGGGIINGQLLYHYVGTTRPWSMHIYADMKKVHEYISEKISVGYYWAKADIYRAVEEMSQNNIIEVKIWDENDQVTAKYKPEKIFDNILTRILDKAFNFYPDIKPEKNQAETSGGRWWWWNGSYSRNSSKVDISEIINIKITIFGKSSPIPVSSGLFLRVPKYAKCKTVNLVHQARSEILKSVYAMNFEGLAAFADAGGRSLSSTLVATDAARSAALDDSAAD